MDCMILNMLKKGTYLGNFHLGDFLYHRSLGYDHALFSLK